MFGRHHVGPAASGGAIILHAGWWENDLSSAFLRSVLSRLWWSTWRLFLDLESDCFIFFFVYSLFIRFVHDLRSEVHFDSWWVKIGEWMENISHHTSRGDVKIDMTGATIFRDCLFLFGGKFYDWHDWKFNAVIYLLSFSFSSLVLVPGKTRLQMFGESDSLRVVID